MQLEPLGGLLLALGLAQALAWGLARGLALRLPWKLQAVGLSLPLVLLLPLLHGGRLLAPTDAPILANLPDAPRVAEPDEAHGVYNDAILQLLPWEAEVRRALLEGRPPFWSDLLDGGSSPWINPQAAVLSPIAMLGRCVPVEHFLLATLAIKMLLAFEGCWLLARLAGAGRLSAALGAGGFALGGPLMAWAVFPLGSVVAWSPWLAVGVVRVLRRPAARWVGALALIAAALLVGGHPEIAAAECLTAAGFGVVLWRRRQQRWLQQPWLHRQQRWQPRQPVARLRGVVAAGRGGGAGLRGLVAAGRGGVAGLRGVVAAGLGGTLGAGLAACALVPFLMAAPHSLRATNATLPSAMAPPPATWFAAGGPALFLSPLNPWSFGRPFREAFTGPANWPIAAGAYLGLVALAGVALGLAGPRRRLAWWLLALAAGIFLLTAGFFPLRWLVSVLPLGRAVALDRFLPAAALPLAVLAALGWDAILRPTWPTRAARPARATRRPRMAGPSLSPALALGAVTCAAAASLAVRHDAPLAAFWLVIGIAVGMAPRKPRRRLVACGLLAMASLLDLGSWDRDVLPRGHRELFYPRTPVITAIAGVANPAESAGSGKSAERDQHGQSDRPGESTGAATGDGSADRSGGAGGPWRAVAAGFGIYPSLLPMYGVADIRIDNPLALAEQLRPLSAIFAFRPEGRRYKSAFAHVDHPFLDFLNVRVVVLPAATPAVPARFELVGGTSSLRVYRNPAALPRWFLPTGADVSDAADTLGAVERLRDARRVVLASEDVGAWRPAERAWDPAAVRVLRLRRGTVSLSLPTTGGGTSDTLLATSLPFPAGWTASTQGNELRTVKVNTAYLGVRVPPKVARVDLTFVPPGFRAGAVLSLLAAAAVGLLMSQAPRRAPRRR